MEQEKNISFLSECIRKGIHVISAAFPIFYLFTDRDVNIWILSVAFGFLFLVDVVRYFSKSFREFYMRLLKPILRFYERNDKKIIFTGATYIVFSYLALVIIFPKEIAITSMFIIAFSDSAAALTGRLFGETRAGVKTIQGSSAFLIIGIVIILLSPKIYGGVTEYFAAFTALAITTIVEVLPLKIDDNISVPLTFAIVYSLMLKILLS